MTHDSKHNTLTATVVANQHEVIGVRSWGPTVLEGSNNVGQNRQESIRPLSNRALQRVDVPRLSRREVLQEERGKLTPVPVVG